MGIPDSILTGKEKLTPEEREVMRQHPIYQQGWNRKGLISPTGQRKLAFGVLAEEYRKLEAAGR